MLNEIINICETLENYETLRETGRVSEWFNYSDYKKYVQSKAELIVNYLDSEINEACNSLKYKLHHDKFNGGEDLNSFDRKTYSDKFEKLEEYILLYKRFKSICNRLYIGIDERKREKHV